MANSGTRESSSSKNATPTKESTLVLRTGRRTNSPKKAKPYDMVTLKPVSKADPKPATKADPTHLPPPLAPVPPPPTDEVAAVNFILHEYDKTLLNILEAREIFSSPSDAEWNDIQRVCRGARLRGEVTALPEEARLGDLFKDVSPLLWQIGANPHEVDLEPWIERDILSRESLPMVGREGVQHVYLRRRLLTREGYIETLTGYMSSYPLDAGWACARLVSDGLAEEAEEAMNTISKILGFTYHFTFRRLKVPAISIYADWYAGITIRTPDQRIEEDGKSKGSTRHLNYSSVSPGCDKDWESVTILPLCQQFDNNFQYRKDPYLNYPEAILVDVLAFSTNSARGGFIQPCQPPTKIVDAIHKLLKLSPSPVQTVAAPFKRREASNFYEKLLALFAEMRQDGHNVGPAIDPSAFADVKGELSDYISTVNGRVPYLTIMKDLPAEIHSGRVRGVFMRDESESGRSLATHEDLMRRLFEAYEGEQMELDEDLREFLGPYLDFWALILLHRWLALLLVILGRLLAILDPLVIHAWSSNLSSIFHRQELATLLEETAGIPLSLQLLENTRVQEMQHAPKDKKFLSRVGKPHLFKIAVEKDAVSLAFPTVDPGHLFHRPALRIPRARLNYLTSGMTICLNRVAAAVASQEPTNAPKLHVVMKIKANFEELCKSSGVDVVLEETRQMVKAFEMGHAVLLGRYVEGDLIHSKQSERGNWKVESRNCGPRARGAAGSREREDQLLEWIADAQERAQMDLEPSYIRPRNWEIGSSEYRSWFLGVEEGKSLLYSANAASNTNRFDIGAFNTEQATKRREEAIRDKGAERTEFDAIIGGVLNALNHPHEKWQDSPGWARCADCDCLCLSKDKNSKHQCAKNSNSKIPITCTKDQFSSSFLRLLYPHDLFNYPGVDHLVNDGLMESNGWVPAPAARFLVDDDGGLLALVPRGVVAAQVRGKVWYKDESQGSQATTTTFLLSMAIDVAVKEASQGRFGETPYASYAVQPFSTTDDRNVHVFRSTTALSAVTSLIQNKERAAVTCGATFLGHILSCQKMTSQGSSRAEFFDLTGDEDIAFDSQTALSSNSQSASAGPSQSGNLSRYPQDNNAHASTSARGALSQENNVSQTENDDSDIEMVEDAPVDEAARRRNLENRRARLRAGGINEEAPAVEVGTAGRQRGDAVAEVIVISDGEVNSAEEEINQWMGPRFWEERRRRRGLRNWADDVEERPRHPNARQASPDPLNFELAPHLLHMTLPNIPRITLGGGGLVSRRRPLPVPNRNAVPSLHRRSMQMDAERFPGRVRAHLDGLIQEQETAYNDLPFDIPGALRNAVERIGDVFSGLSWGNERQVPTFEDDSNEWGPILPPVRGNDIGWGGGGGGGRRGRGRERFAVGAIMQGPGFGGPPPDEEEPPLDLPEAPPWQVSFTHPGKMPHGFTSDIAPVEPELIVLEDSDEERKRKKGKGKARALPPNAVSETQSGRTLMLVCTVCRDPLYLGGETEDERVYGLRCGHVMDGKCIWRIGRPPESQPPPVDPSVELPGSSKGKGRVIVEPKQTSMDIDPHYKFTFVPPPALPAHVEEAAPAPTSTSEPVAGPSTSSAIAAYEEDNAPRAAPHYSRSNPTRSSRRHDEIVPTPNISRRARTRGQTQRNALDGVDDEYVPPDLSTAPLDVTDPFFPVVHATRNSARGARGTRSGGTRRGGKGKKRRVPNTKGKLKEEVFEWMCPVSGCGRAHTSVRLEMEGAKWRCDPLKGAVLMFL